MSDTVGAAADAALASAKSPRCRVFNSSTSIPVSGGLQGLSAVIEDATALIDPMKTLDVNDKADADIQPSKIGAIQLSVDGDTSAPSARRLFNESVRRPLASPPSRMHLLTALHPHVHRLATLRISLRSRRSTRRGCPSTRSQPRRLP